MTSVSNASERSTRKCPSCGQWSEWSRVPGENCHHCGAVLDPQSITIQAEQQADSIESKKGIDIELIPIHPDDSFLLKSAKYGIRALQISFIGIVSFILWVLTLTAG